MYLLPVYTYKTSTRTRTVLTINSTRTFKNDIVHILFRFQSRAIKMISFIFYSDSDSGLVQLKMILFIFYSDSDSGPVQLNDIVHILFRFPSKCSRSWHT